MTIHQTVAEQGWTEMSADGMVLIPENIRKERGLAPGRTLVVALNDRGEVVVLTRTQAKRLGETADERGARMDQAFASLGDRFSTGQSTDEIMEELRGPRDE